MEGYEERLRYAVENGASADAELDDIAKLLRDLDSFRHTGGVPDVDTIKVLDHGFVQLVDVMGDDHSIVEAARVSLQGGEGRALQDDRALIRYLLRHKHTTPFEMVEFKFNCKMPIFVARQWIRHRTANVNEVSARYSELPGDYYLPQPEHVNYQDPKNRQMRAGLASAEVAKDFIEQLEASTIEAYREYQAHLGKTNSGEVYLPDNWSELTENGGIARELARVGLPLNMYTQWFWKIDLHNLLHFLRLRLDKHAQYEIRVYAEAMAEVVKATCPLAWEAFEDFSLYSMTLTRYDILNLRAIAEGGMAVDFPTKREGEEFVQKLEKLGINNLNRR